MGPESFLNGGVLFSPTGEVDAHAVENGVAKGVGQRTRPDPEYLEVFVVAHETHLTKTVVAPLPGDLAVSGAPADIAKALVGRRVVSVLSHVRSPPQ